MSLNAARSHAWLAGASQCQYRIITVDDSFASVDAMIADGSGDPEVQHAQENANGARHGKRKLEPYSNHALDADVENGNLKKPRRVPAAVARGREDGGSSPMARLQEAAVGMVVEEEHMQEELDGAPAPAADFAPRRKSARGARRG
jgi:serine/threonine/tyrosine protein kinase RAD53